MAEHREAGRRYALTTMVRSDVDVAMQWAAEQGWNPGLHDADVFHATDPEGFFITRLDGEAIGVCAAVCYDPGYAFFGLYMVKAPYRGRHYGFAMTSARLAYIGDRTAGLDGVVEMQAKYTEIGFRHAYRNVRHEGVGGGVAPLGLVELAALPFEQVLAYDRAVYPAPRPRFLHPWIAQPGASALGVVRGGDLHGYGVLRPCRVGYKIGPLFADDRVTAERLFHGLMARAPGAPVFLDTPEVNGEAVAMARARGMTPMFETARMYRGRPPQEPLGRVFGITTFELG